MSRNMFEELSEGFDALEKEREGKVTLRTHKVEQQPAPTISNQEIRKLRESLNLSRGVFAARLRVSSRTLENWEQGRSNPPAHSALLLRMLQKYPDTLERMENV